MSGSVLGAMGNTEAVASSEVLRAREDSVYVCACTHTHIYIHEREKGIN